MFQGPNSFRLMKSNTYPCSVQPSNSNYIHKGRAVADIRGRQRGRLPPPIISDLQKYCEDSLVLVYTLALMSLPQKNASVSHWGRGSGKSEFLYARLVIMDSMFCIQRGEDVKVSRLIDYAFLATINPLSFV